MVIEYGVHTISRALHDLICEEKHKDGWRIFRLPSAISSAREFMAAAHSSLPADPPIFADSDSWDALSDSIWGGIHALHVVGALVIWPDSGTLRRSDPKAYEQIVDIFDSISKTIRQPQYGGGLTTHFLVLLTQSD